jgi:hypothetical protein
MEMDEEFKAALKELNNMAHKVSRLNRKNMVPELLRERLAKLAAETDKMVDDL